MTWIPNPVTLRLLQSLLEKEMRVAAFFANKYFSITACGPSAKKNYFDTQRTHDVDSFDFEAKLVAEYSQSFRQGKAKCG